MSIRQRFGRGVIRLALGVVAFVALAMPADAQVDPDAIPLGLQLSSREDCRALRACLGNQALRDEVEACFAAGPIRTFEFRLFYEGPTDSVYFGKLVFGSSSAALSLNIAMRIGQNPTIITTTTTSAPASGNLAIIPDLASYDFLVWFVQENIVPLAQFAEENGVRGICCTRTLSRVSESHRAQFVGGALDFTAFTTVSQPRQLQLVATASYVPAFGYYDLQID